MTSAVTTALKQRVLRHEGLRLKVYTCPRGKLTIGIGRNLEDKGITRAEAFYLLENDLKHAECDCQNAFQWFEKLDTVRRGVVIEMVFNLGFQGFLGFCRLIKALTIQDFDAAAREMLNSRWAVQVGHRAEKLAKIMRTGKEV